MISIEELDAVLERTEKIRNTLIDIETMVEDKENKFIPASIDDRLLTVEQVAERLNTGKHTVYNLLNKGYLPYLVIGNKKVRESTLVKFMADFEGYDLTTGEKIEKIS